MKLKGLWNGDCLYYPDYLKPADFEKISSRTRKILRKVALLSTNLDEEGFVHQESTSTVREEIAVHEGDVNMTQMSKNQKLKRRIQEAEANLCSCQSKLDTLEDEVGLHHYVENTLRSSLAASQADVWALRQSICLTTELYKELKMKQSWLLYCGLAKKLGIDSYIASMIFDKWIASVPNGYEYVIKAGRKAIEDHTNQVKMERDSGLDLSCEDSITTLLSVEASLKIIASLKIEDSIVSAITRFNGQGLSEEARNDIRFKQCWLLHFWKRCLDFSFERSIAERSLVLLTGRFGQEPTIEDAFDVEQGLRELRKLGAEDLCILESR